MCAPSADCCASLILIKSFADERKDKESGGSLTCYKSSKATVAPLMFTLNLWCHTVNVLLTNPGFDVCAVKSVTSVDTYAVNCVRNHLCCSALHWAKWQSCVGSHCASAFSWQCLGPELDAVICETPMSFTSEQQVKGGAVIQLLNDVPIFIKNWIKSS